MTQPAQSSDYCAKCHLMILQPNVNYGINPDAVCKCPSAPAQISGHEWVMDYPNVPLGHCRCGYGRTFGANGIDPSEHAVHVASVAQAAQPQEVPAEQRDFRRAIQLLSTCIPDIIFIKDGKWSTQEPNDEGDYETIDFRDLLAQPASAAKPAEQRALCPSCRASDNEPFTDANGVAMRACGRCMIQWRAAQPASAAKPTDYFQKPVGTNSLLSAKPSEDGLEAQVTAWLFTQFGKRFGWTNEGDIESLANFIRTQARAANPCHGGMCRDEMIWRDVIAARERELRELLDDITMHLTPLNIGTDWMAIPESEWPELERRLRALTQPQEVPAEQRELRDSIAAEIGESFARNTEHFQAREHAAANDMLRMVVGSLKMYPNGSGDIGVMSEVERIERAARLNEMEMVRENGGKNWDDEMDIYVSQRIAELERALHPSIGGNGTHQAARERAGREALTPELVERALQDRSCYDINDELDSTKLCEWLISQSRAAEERERELREKLEGLAAEWRKTHLNISEKEDCIYEVCAEAVESLLASHWPARPSKTETPKGEVE